MTVDFESFNDVLKHPIRRKVILTLGNNKTLSYVELLNITETANTGKFNYHLKILADLIQKDDAGKYCLTEKGQLAFEFLEKFPEKKPELPSNLQMVDAALIGLAGVFLITANPTLWIGLWLSINKLTVPVYTLLFFGFGSLFYSFFIPSYVMRLLTVKRAHSNEMYTLFRAPLFTFIILLGITTAMLLTGTHLYFNAMINSPTVIVEQGSNWTHSAYSGTGVSLFMNFIQGLVFSFLGVALIEFISRAKKKRRGN